MSKCSPKFFLTENYHPKFFVLNVEYQVHLGKNMPETNYFVSQAIDIYIPSYEIVGTFS